MNINSTGAFDAFISYASEDAEKAETIAKELSAIGKRVWFDQDCIIGGQRWNNAIQEAISSCRYFVVLISESWSRRDRFVYEELQNALKLCSSSAGTSPYIVPVLLEQAPVPMSLRRYRCINMSNERERGLRQLIATLGEDFSKDDQVILGFDLGHGESAFALTTTMSQKSPSVLDVMGRQSILTAVAQAESGAILIGDDAYHCSGPRSLALAFKNRDMSDKSLRDSVRLFVQECFRVLRETAKLPERDQPVVVVGVPSGWSEADRELYRTLLLESGLQKVELRPESRAAFLDAYDGKDLPKFIDGYALIIDIGSSTTDYTLVRDYKESPVDFGNVRLGAYLIDKLILESSLRDISNEVVRKKVIDDRVIKARCLLKCRQIKERYFNSESVNRGLGGDISDREWVDDDLPPVKIQVSDRSMGEVLDSPILELDGLSWRQTFLKELSEISASYAPALVLMTGGGSRMSFTVDLAREVFGSGKVRVLPEPMTAIAKGLALAGRTDRKMTKFRQEISDYLESANFVWMIQQDMPALCRTLASNLFDIVKAIAIRRFREWKAGGLASLEEMEELIKNDLSSYVDGEGKQDLQRQIQSWLVGIGKDIELEVRNICFRYTIPEVAFGLEDSASAIDFSAGNLKYADLLNQPAEAIAATISLFVVTAIAGVVATIPGVFVPLIGTIITLIIGLIASVGFADSIQSDLKKWDLPSPVRRLVTESRLTKRMLDQRLEIEQHISRELEKQLLSPERFKGLLDQVRAKLDENANRVSVLIS